MSISLQSVLNQDGAQRYKDTFLEVSHKNHKQLMYCGEMTNDGTVMYDAGGNRHVFHANDGVSIDIVMPHAEWKQFGRNTVLLQRQPARQWKRSLSRTTHTIVPDFNFVEMAAKDKELAHSMMWPELRSKYVDLVQAMLDSKGVSCKEGIEKLKDFASVALSGNFMLSKSGSLLLGTSAIAKFHFKQDSYTVVPLFQEELRDLTRGLNFKEVVKDALN